MSDRKLDVLDAYMPCCGMKFRDYKEITDHQLADLPEHAKDIKRIVKQHARMWAILKQSGKAVEMRKLLDLGEMDWWREREKVGGMTP